MNLVPSQYRNVSVADVPVALDEESLRAHLVGRPVYRRTRYVVARHGAASAVVEVSKESELPLFSPVTEMSVLARPDETAFVDAPETDTGVPTQMARVAARHAPGARCVIVRGRYGHVSFILEPAPIRIGVVEVVPPWPPKLADQLGRVLELAEDLPPVELVPHLVDLDALAATRPAEHYLFPCRAGEPAGTGPAPRPKFPTWTRSPSGSRGRWSGAPGPGPSTTGSTATRYRWWTCARAGWPRAARGLARCR